MVWVDGVSGVGEVGGVGTIDVWVRGWHGSNFGMVSVGGVGQKTRRGWCGSKFWRGYHGSLKYWCGLKKRCEWRGLKFWRGFSGSEVFC